jgi:hypothetical protein
MSEIADYIASLSDDAEDVDLSAFELIEELHDASWDKLKSNMTMKRLKLPPALLTIKERTFMDHSQLTDVTFPSSLRSIGSLAFYECSGLAIRDFKLPDSLERLGNMAFHGCDGLTGKLSTHITGDFSFAYCTGLTELDLVNCKEIEEHCFSDCTGLIGNLKLPSTLQCINAWAFRDCSGLTGPLIIPPFVKHIVHEVSFLGCSGMPGWEEAVEEHEVSFESWKARGNVLMTLIAFDEEYRRVVEQNGGRLNSALSNSFLSGISKDAQLIYKATAHVDGTDNLANGICRLIISFLPMDRRYLGTMLSDEEIEALIDEGFFDGFDP